jgi:hypothetical protein
MVIDEVGCLLELKYGKSLASKRRHAIINTRMTNPTPIDITNIPELRHLVEEMRASRQPRLLKQDRESVALLMPLGTSLKQQVPTPKDDVWTDYDTEKVRTALAQSAGTLAGVQRESLLTDIRNERSQEKTNRL